MTSQAIDVTDSYFPNRTVVYYIVSCNALTCHGQSQPHVHRFVHFNIVVYILQQEINPMSWIL